MPTKEDTPDDNTSTILDKLDESIQLKDKYNSMFLNNTSPIASDQEQEVDNSFLNEIKEIYQFNS